MKQYILAIDQGTTSSRAILFDEKGQLVASAQKEITNFFPHPGWVEIDPFDILFTTSNVITDVCAKANTEPGEIKGAGITNQRETTIVWDKKTGRPVYPAIVWQSKQNAEICSRYLDKKDFIHEKTGLFINPYFSATKIRFILDHIPNGQKRAENGELCFGTVDTWLVYCFTKKKSFYTDVTNASRTLLFNIHTLSWDQELCDLFNIPMCMLPEIKASSDMFGIANVDGIEVPITGVVGDQQGALFGQTCFEKGQSKNTYGTGCFMLMNTGKKAYLSNNGLLTTVAWKIGDEVTYALEGSVFMGGASVQWLRDQMELIKDAAESEKAANEVKDNSGIYVVPAFVGLGTPYWDDDARGAVFGLTRGTNKNHFIRATLEGICYQCKDVFNAMINETGIRITSLQVDGGASANKYITQFQADILQTPISLPACLETTALGAAYLAGLYVGLYTMDKIIKNHKIKATFNPIMDDKEADELYKGWQKAVEATRIFKR